MKSMTGFGRGKSTINGFFITAEIKSLNSKSTEIGMKFPVPAGENEIKLRNLIKKNFFRGRFDVLITIQPVKKTNSTILPSEEFIRQLLKEISEIQKKFKVKGKIDLPSLIQIIKEPELTHNIPMTELESGINSAFNNAMAMLNISRIREGKKIFMELKNRLKKIKAGLKKILRIHPKYKLEKKEEFFAKASIASPEAASEHSRIEQEFALWLEKRDFTEETSRLKFHIEEFERFMICKEEPKGKKLDFFIQEMLRETTTLSAKANEHRIIQNCIDIKTELERMREQIQNIE
ncbi:MAG TPA: DUF1732 domain-containing protein [bacterium]